MVKGKGLVAAALAVVAVGVTQMPQAANAGSVSRMHMLHQHSAVHGASTGGNLIDHGGPVLATTHVYVIFWGSSSRWSSDVQSGVSTFFNGLNGSSYVNTATQYLHGQSESITLSGSRSDTSSPPTKVSTSTLVAEAQRVYGTLDPAGEYVVYTSNFPRGGNFCAWHSGGTLTNGQPFSVAYMPNTGGVAGCDPGNLYGVPGSQDLRSLLNVTAHEVMESLTDPQLNAWYDGGGSEIGDKCAWQFGSAVTLGTTRYQLQEEWSNAANGCVQIT